MRQSVMDIDDPRLFATQADGAQTPLFEMAEASLAASSVSRADEIDRALVTALAQRLIAGEGSFVADLLAAAPSAPVVRHLWRRAIDAWRAASRADDDEGLTATLFAIPLVLVAAGKDGDGEIAGVLGDTQRIAAILREHRALGGSETFALAPPLVASDAFDLPRLPQLLAWQRQAADGGVDHLDLHPTPIASKLGQEGVHLRFLAGVALAAPHADLLREGETAAGAMALAQELARQLAGPGYSVLALPRAAQSPLAALQQGRAAQRDIGAQLFASNAIRRLRASVGEPSAVISAHRCAGAPGGGELRLSLSSAFDPSRAEGFRCPLFAGDRASEVARMLADLMRDCRVTDVQTLPGVHADRDPATGLTLLFKADAVADARQAIVH
ncbi:MAG TPA: hypothetical protein VHZ01_09910 [Casimicrobiaceae bacterium]|nr:hypothetical protein [Casimicrobiaceae bacterium]